MIASNRRRHLIILTIILVTAAAIRISLFSGLVGSDDLVYSKNAWDLASGNYKPSPSPLSNRIGHIGLIAASFKIFGIGGGKEFSPEGHGHVWPTGAGAKNLRLSNEALQRLAHHLRHR